MASSCNAVPRRDDLMQRAIAVSRRLLVCPRGTALVGYTSLMLLFAVAALIVLGHADGRQALTRDAKTVSSN
jgi:hypothetical protein